MSQLLDLKRELWGTAPISRARRAQLQAMIGALVRLKTGGFIKDGFEKTAAPAQERLFAGFAEAMLDKAVRSQEKRARLGLSNLWTATDWQADLVTDLWLHAQKGDPLDVAIYSAFAWWHGWRVSAVDTGFEFEHGNEYKDGLKWHDLKVAPEFMVALSSGAKPFEVRRDDRGFAVGDGLLLREFDGERYTGTEGRFVITSALRGAKWGVMPGFVCLGIRPVLYVEKPSLLDWFGELPLLPEVNKPEPFGGSVDVSTLGGGKRSVPKGPLCDVNGKGCEYDAACARCIRYQEPQL
jgi:hypothetical protein